jgi:hexokinase
MHADMFLRSSTDGPLAAKNMTASDEETLQEIINGIYRRTAKLTAINITAAVLKSGEGSDPTRPVCINIDGTTYYKSVGFKEMVETYLQDILGQRNISYILMHVEDAPLIGAAIGGLS